MITHSRIKELATQIQSDSTELDKGLSLLGLQSPTFSISMVDELPPELHAAQRSLLAATDELSLLIRGPLQTLMYLASYSVRTHTTFSYIDFYLRSISFKYRSIN